MCTMVSKIVLSLKYTFILLVLFCSSLVYAGNYTLYLTPRTAETALHNSTFLYQFNLTNSSDCTGVIYSTTQTLRTDSLGVVSSQLNVTNLTSTPQYLCEYRNNTLRKTHTFGVGIFSDLYTYGNLSIGSKITFPSGFIQSGAGGLWFNSTVGDYVFPSLTGITGSQKMWIRSSSTNTSGLEIGEDGITGFRILYNALLNQTGLFLSEFGGNQLIIGNATHADSEYGHPDQVHPTVFLHSKNAPTLNYNDWGALYHNGTSFLISTGNGTITLQNDTLLERNVSIIGDLNVIGLITVNKNLTVINDLNVTGSTWIKRNLTVVDDLNVTGAVRAQRNVTIIGNLTVTGVTVHGRVQRVSITTMSGGGMLNLSVESNQSTLITINGGGGPGTTTNITLPKSITSTGLYFVFKRTDGSTNRVYISTTGGDTIDGATFTNFSGIYNSTTVVSDGSEWFLIGQDVR
ncbi:MAG: hypothetical protein AABX37_05155 [Nanoarchaeota archaeon]